MEYTLLLRAKGDFVKTVVSRNGRINDGGKERLNKRARISVKVKRFNLEQS